MVEQATEQITIAAPADRCFEVAADFEHYPEWAADVKEVSVLERDANGRGAKVAFRAAAMGRSARYTLAYEYSDDPLTLAWKLVDGDIMRRLDGEYVFSPSAGSTDVTYRLAVELVIPLPGFLKRRAEGKIMGTALRELKRRVEA